MSPAARGFPLQLLLGGALAFGLGLALGFLANGFYLIGLLPLGLGLLVGAGCGFVAVMTGGPWRGGARAAAVLAVVIGWSAFQYADDAGFQRAYAADVARTRALSDQVPTELLDDPNTAAFLAKDAPEILDAAVVEEVGQGGFVGRWLFRAQRGVRLVGPLTGGRGLPVGTAGAIAWSVLEILLAVALAELVIRRLERAVRARLDAA